MTPAPPTPEDTPPRYRRWLHYYSFMVLAVTFSLVAIGGHVTSTESGMAVPDGWFTFGWWSLFAPPSLWWHEFGTFWEHSHRIVGSVVGILTIGMLAALIVTQRGRRRVIFGGVGILLLVCMQGALGAQRVDGDSITLAFIHGIGGQTILCLWVLLAAALSRPWVARLAAIRQGQPSRAPRKLRWFTLAMLAALFVQLTLGAAVRHYKADKALPDFPLHYGQVLPPMNQDALDDAYLAYHAGELGISLEQAKAQGWSNRSPRDGSVVLPAWKVHLHFTHRLWAYGLLVAGVTLVTLTLRSRLDQRLLLTPALLLLSLFVLQVSLGVITVLTETDIFAATMHQATGALLIATATWLALRIHLAGYPAAAQQPEHRAQNSHDTGTTPRPTPA